MSEEPTPDVNEIKERLKIEVEVEGEPSAEQQEQQPRKDVAAELREMGQKFTETLRAAWQSEERQKIEVELREGLKSFADEVDHLIHELKEGETAEKVKKEATEIKVQIKSGELGQKAKEGLATSLRWLSQELGRLADQFTTTEKAAQPETAESSTDTDTETTEN
ncbi:MAG: hypothetical protein D6706_12955 [Chloroflexi bacterium]|nr:MAG: hypothetical protein D6706_12955 [Chloroflexota bacterium]